MARLSPELCGHPGAVWPLITNSMAGAAWACPAGARGPPMPGLSCLDGTGASCAGGKSFSCPAYDTGVGGCIVKEVDAVRVCDALPGCAFISRCSIGEPCKGWNAAHPDSVQLGWGHVNSVNKDWETCMRAPPDHALALVGLVLAAAAAYVAAGVLLGARTGGSGLKRHPHFGRWVAVAGLVQDGIAFARSGGERRNRLVVGDAKVALVAADKAAGARRSTKKAGKSASGSQGSSGKKRGKASRDESDAAVEEPASQQAEPAEVASPGPASTASGTAASGGGRW